MIVLKCLLMLTFSTLFSLVSLLNLGPLSIASAHWEDPAGCSKTHEKIKSLKDEWESVYSGIAEDGRDYVYRWKHKGSTLITEEHFILTPQNQWDKPDEPEHLPVPVSEWLDWDGDGHFGEWYLFPRLKAECSDALHFIWDEKAQTYKLYATGKERT